MAAPELPDRPRSPCTVLSEPPGRPRSRCTALLGSRDDPRSCSAGRLVFPHRPRRARTAVRRKFRRPGSRRTAASETPDRLCSPRTHDLESPERLCRPCTGDMDQARSSIGHIGQALARRRSQTCPPLTRAGLPEAHFFPRGNARPPEKPDLSSSLAGRFAKKPISSGEPPCIFVATDLSSCGEPIATGGNRPFFLYSSPCHRWQPAFLPMFEPLPPVAADLSSCIRSLATGGKGPFQSLSGPLPPPAPYQIAVPGRARGAGEVFLASAADGIRHMVGKCWST